MVCRLMLPKEKKGKTVENYYCFNCYFSLLLPTILCIILGIQLTKLKDQVDYLFSTYLSSTDDYNYAYASIDDLADEILNGFNEQQTDESDMDSDDYADGNVEDKVNDGIIKNDMDNNTDNVNGINNDMEDDISAVNPYAVDFADVDDDIIEDTDTDEGLMHLILPGLTKTDRLQKIIQVKRSTGIRMVSIMVKGISDL